MFYFLFKRRPRRSKTTPGSLAHKLSPQEWAAKLRDARQNQSPITAEQLDAQFERCRQALEQGNK